MCSVLWPIHFRSLSYYLQIQFSTGKEKRRFSSDEKNSAKDADFEVYCVLKTDDTQGPIPAEILIKQVEPRDACSGTNVETGVDVVLGVKRYSEHC